MTFKVDSDLWRLTDVFCTHRGWAWVIHITAPDDRFELANSAWLLTQTN